MAANHLIEKRRAEEEARQVLQGWFTSEEIAQAVSEVGKADPPVAPRERRDLILETAMRIYQAGRGYI